MLTKLRLNMQNYAKTLEIIRIQNEAARRVFETAIQSPFSYPVTQVATVSPVSPGSGCEWQPLLDYPENLSER